MNEVSHRAVRFLLDALVARGIAPGRLVEGLPVGLDQLRDPRARFDWELHVRLLERAGELLGGPEELEEAGASVLDSVPLQTGRALAGLLFNAAQIYRMGARWLGPSYFTHIGYGVEELADGRLRFTVEIPDGYAPSRPLFLLNKGALRAAPRLLGGGEAQVDLEIEGGRASYLIRPPRRLPLIATVRRILRMPFAATRAIEELGEQQADLNRRHRELAAMQRELGATAESLETLDRLGRELVLQLESDGLGDGLLEALLERFGWSGAALWVGSGDDPQLLAQCGAGPGAPRSLPLAVGGRRVGRLDVWGPADALDPESEDLLGRMLPWIAMAVANARAGGEEAPAGFRWRGEEGKDLFLIVDSEGGVRYAGPSIERILGVGQVDALHLDIQGLVHPEDLRGLTAVFASFGSGNPGSARFDSARLRHTDGSWRTVEGVGIKVMDEHGQAVFMFSCSDVTDRLRAH